MSQESYNHNERERISLAVSQASQDSRPTKSTQDTYNWKFPYGLSQVKKFLLICNVFSSIPVTHFKVVSKPITYYFPCP